MDIDVSNIKQECDSEIGVLEIKTEPIENAGLNEFGLCEPCKGDGIVTKAEGKCLECDDSMCSTCFRHHRKAKPCRYHTLVGDTTKQSASEENETRIKCKHHPAEKIEFYCQNHDTVGCRECIVLAHKSCKTELIELLSTNFHESENLKSLLTKLSDLASAFRECELKRCDAKTENEVMHAQALEAIKSFRKDIDNFLYVEERFIFSELEKLRSDNSTELENLERDSKAILSKIERLKQKLDTGVYHGEALFINSAKCKLYIPGIEKALAKITSGGNARKYTFVPDKYLSGLVDSSKHLGHFETSDCKTVAPDQPVAVLHEKQPAAPKSPRRSNVQNTDNLNKGKKRKRNETRQVNAVKAKVGSRVRPGPCFTYDWDHRNKPGTVTSLEPDGTVTVELVWITCPFLCVPLRSIVLKFIVRREPDYGRVGCNREVMVRISGRCCVEWG
ncbi:E3 ubiquitin-protein ligase TRIM45-like [Ruditapes philippinarum]|uniref:E3 ubiquitin-protein ligase TRIM45-like n=1 Tax=Ruditapes philippinarum TaxID=129788 RepID=UPI00295B99B5|nr:E3 ubiquitin-protein ligase TRIM45-like [Ruditapes philippinarum]